jgi:hypothetical protein
MKRRTFLSGVAAGAIGGGALAWGASKLLLPGSSSGTLQGRLVQAKVAQPSGKLGIPGPYPGRVIEVNHKDACKGSQRNEPVIKQMIDRGMRELVGAPEGADAWRSFFSPGDRVGIKVNPVGQPHSVSSKEVVKEVVAALNQLAKVDLKDIILFDRYYNEFVGNGYNDLADELGIHWECSSMEYDELQNRIDGQHPDRPRSKKVAGYDPDVFRELPFCGPQHDPHDDRSYRSHLGMIISRKIDKYIGIPVIKDHRSAGITLALKNLSHGSVNNVCRSHSSYWNAAVEAYEPGMTLNQCGTFIPAMVSLPTIREKAVLQIGDGLVATFEGGPGVWNNPYRTWNYNSLLFATDPVAMDHIGWEIVDKKRAEEGYPLVAEMGLESNYGLAPRSTHPRRSESFHMRQPEHIPLASTLGLGVFTRHLIRHKRIDLA